MSENKFHKSRIFFKTALCDVIVIIIIYDTKNNTQEKKSLSWYISSWLIIL